MNSDLEWLPETVLGRLRASAVPVSALVPQVRHLGESRWPELADLLPLPESRIRGRIAFCCDEELDRRLVVDGQVQVERAAGEAGRLELTAEDLSDAASHICVLEVDEGGGFEARIQVSASRISAVEQAVVDRALASGARDEIVAALLVFGLSNDLIEMLWDQVRAENARAEEAVAVLRALHQAFESASTSENLSVFGRRDKYLDAMDRVREVLNR